MKNFQDWNTKKIKLDSNPTFKHPKEKEIWWCSIGVNVGSEVFGKGDSYTRPVLVVNAEGSESFIGIPLTSNIKNKKYSCIIKTDDGVLHTALVYQVRSFDKRRLTERKYVLHSGEYAKIEEYFRKLYKI
jgi:mRNA interferase MazF